MGFQSGNGLGKNRMGRSEPIPLGIKHGRLGLGLMEETQRALLEAQVQNSGLKASFLNAKKRAFEVSKITQDMERAQKVCKELDIASGVKKSDSWDKNTLPSTQSVQNTAETEVITPLGR